ncbi:PAAR domain-containing protein [Vibrio owensii]
MMNDVITIDSPTTTGGKVISGSGSVKINGKAIALIGDMATCTCGSKSCRGQGPIIKKTPRNANLNGQDVARVGDFVDTGCGSCFLLPSSHQVALSTSMATSLNMGGGVNMGNGVNINMGGAGMAMPSVSSAIVAKQSVNSTMQPSVTSASHPENSLANTSSSLPPYLTGNYPQSQTEPTYPIYKNTRIFPDQQVRDLLQANNHDVMLLTLSETFAYLQTEGWKQTKQAWVEATDTTLGQIMINYGPNGKDVVTTSMVVSKLGSLRIKATIEMNHLGNEIIKFTGWPNIRKILNAPRFRLDNPKVVDVGIGKYGLKNSIVSGARLTFYVAAAYRTVDFILNDEITLNRYIGSLAADVVKIGIVSALTWGVGAVVVTPFVVFNLAIVVTVGLLFSLGVNYIDTKYGITDAVVEYLDRAQQEMVEQAKRTEDLFWDLGAMLADGLLDTGRKVIESEIKAYARKTLQEIKPRLL